MKVKNAYFDVDNVEDFEFFDEYSNEDKSNLVRNNGLDSYEINKKYEEHEID